MQRFLPFGALLGRQGDERFFQLRKTHSPNLTDQNDFYKFDSIDLLLLRQRDHLVRLLVPLVDRLGGAEDERVGRLHDVLVLAVVGNGVEHVPDGHEPRALLVVGADDGPRRVGGVGVEKHRFLRLGVGVPAGERLDVHRAELPLLERIAGAAHEAAQLLLAADGEPELEEVFAAAHEHALELGRLAHELEVIVRRAEAHDVLDARAVVPGAVEENDLARGRQLLDVALEIPLALFAFGGLGQRDDGRAARIEEFGEALDRAALARGVAALEKHDDLARRSSAPRPASSPARSGDTSPPSRRPCS